MLNKKYKSRSITIPGSNHSEALNGNSAKSSRRDVRGINTHGAGIVDGIIQGSVKENLHSRKVVSKAKGRGVGTEELSDSVKEQKATSKSKEAPLGKVSNSSIKITMGQDPVSNDGNEVRGVYLNNKLKTIETNFKRAKKR